MPTMLALALLVAVGATGAGVWTLVHLQRLRRRETVLQGLLGTFIPAVGLARENPRELLTWHATARMARSLFPEAFEDLDRAMGDTFPFSRAHVEEAHARWTADWLAWERTHDFTYKLKASDAEHELEQCGQLGSALGKARLESIEREQLERYQARYEEYVTVAKALAALESPQGSAGGSRDAGR